MRRAQVAEGETNGDGDIVFTRAVTAGGASSQYRINGAERSWEEYAKALGRINIVTKARNFLVFQVRERRRVGRAARAGGRGDVCIRS
jgi:chromosome segregation ATPase